MTVLGESSLPSHRWKKMVLSVLKRQLPFQQELVHLMLLLGMELQLIQHVADMALARNVVLK